ncbi:MAG: alpha/beta hydrolase [Deltaproteobacteria bacterium]
MTATRGDHHVRGMRLAFHTWGAPSSPAVLVLHGFMDHGRAYAPAVELLERDFYVIAPDLRGHGASDWVGAGGYYHFYDYFFDVRALLRHLAVERFSIVGHSMGGSVATGFAALNAARVDRVMLLEGMGPPFSKLADTVTRLSQWSEALEWDRVSGDVATRRAKRRVMKDEADAASKLRGMNPRLSEVIALRLASTFTEPSEDGAGVVWCYDPLHRTPAAKPFVREEAEAYWSTLSMPVLSLYGEHGWAPDDVAERHAIVPDLRTRKVLGAGHNIHHDKPATVARLMEAFLGDGEVPALEDLVP